VPEEIGSAPGMDAPALWRRGRRLLQEGRAREAAVLLDRALLLDPCFSPALDARARAHLELGESEAAVALLERAVAAPGAGVELHNNLAVALMRAAQPLRSSAVFDEALRRFGPRPVLLENRARLRQEQGDLEGALQDLSDVVLLTPGDPEAWRRLAGNLLHMRALRPSHHAWLVAARLTWAQGDSRRRAAAMAMLGALVGLAIRTGLGESPPTSSRG
jgi:tetratricopeptide (TPR) repeat protein